jgi:hypothetical protein
VLVTLSCGDGAQAQKTAAVGASRGALDSAPSVSTFVLYAERSVTFADHDSVFFGDVGVRTPAVSTFGTQLAVGPYSAVDSGFNLLAPSVALGPNSRVGDVQTSSLQNNGGTLGTLGPFPASAMPPLPLALPSVGSGPDVTVAPLKRTSLAPGSYGALRVSGTLFLSPGTYSFTSASVDAGAAIWAQPGGTVDVRIRGQLSLGVGGAFLPVPRDFSAGMLTISVSGADSPGGVPSAVTLGDHCSIIALLTAPHGTITIGDHVVARGAFAGFDIRAGSYDLFFFETGFPPTSAQPHGSQQLQGYVTPAIAGAPLLGPVPPDTIISLAVGLPLPNPSALRTAVQQVSDPKSPSFRKYLTVDQFTATYAPSLLDYQSIQTWAQSVGLAVNTYPNRLLMDVTGTAATVGQALYLNLVLRQRPDGSAFYSVDREPSLDLSTTIQRISGLDNSELATPGAAPGASPGAGTGPGGSYDSNDLRTAYASCTALNGAGQSVGLLEFDGFTASDVTVYECNAGVVACTAGVPNAAVPAIQTQTRRGTTGTPSWTVNASALAPSLTNGSFEVALDIDMAIGMAPGLAQVVVFEAQNTGSVALANDILNRMATVQPLIRQLSSSWFFRTDDNTQPVLYQLALQGQSFYQAAGDSGSASWSGDPGDIRDRDAITVVGGTTLTLGGAPLAYGSETTWNLAQQGAGGGGLATNVTIPLYQSGVDMSANGGSTTQRNLPDVSAVATALFVVSTSSTSVNQFSNAFGTSAAAPIWAGFAALANQQAATSNIPPLGFANPFLYSVGGAAPAIYGFNFNDINDSSNNAGSCVGGSVSSSPCSVTSGGTTSDNWTPSAGSFSAVTGYDLATGLGTPKCALVNALATGTISAPPPPPGPGGFTVSATVTSGSRGVDICITGTGATPGGEVDVVYLDAPVFGGNNINSIGRPVIAVDGSYESFDFTFGGGASAEYGFASISCTAADAARNLTIQATDKTTGKVATTTIAEALLCGSQRANDPSCPAPPP